MGYTTDFEGQFTLDKPLTVAHLNYLAKFSEIRHMKRDADKLKPDEYMVACGMDDVGKDGEFYVGGNDISFSAMDEDIIDHNSPPKGVPGLWCQWTPTVDGTCIQWDGGEKFYNYIQWLKYIIDNFLSKWGYKLNGTVKWFGEGRGDIGTIKVHDNKIKTT